MWTDYEPTPLTREWLEENNYLPHIEYEYDPYLDPGPPPIDYVD